VIRDFGFRVLCSLITAAAICVAVLGVSEQCNAADVLVVGSGEEQGTYDLRIATDFFGLDLRFVRVDATSGETALKKTVQRRETVAVVILENSLGLVNQKLLLNSLNRRPGESVPLFVAGLTPETDSNVLRAWFGGIAVAHKTITGSVYPKYVIAHQESVTRQLSGIEFPFAGNDTAYFLLSKNVRARPIMAVRTDDGDLPLFLETALGKIKVFLSVAGLSRGKVVDEWSPENLVRAFAQIGPAMMFIRYSAGEHAWHFQGHYANLTIDDPWLRNQYGYLDYGKFLAEMEKHNFHSTIAFIPWNYDRSQPGVVSLFRNHADRLSISVHGDNHDHKEFTDYRSKPLATQTAALKQALARMDKFNTLTGLRYDKVMVFPHSIAPAETLAALKTYNYLATVNAFNVPMDRPTPPLIPFALRPVTLDYSNFPSIRRYPPEVPVAFVAMNEFLDNPLFFYCHHDFFARGIGAFDAVADEVNKRQPETRWVSLGELAQHLYLIKLRGDFGYDVLPYSNVFRLENLSSHDSVFYVKKAETGLPAVRSVTLDGQDYPFRIQDRYLGLTIPIPAGKRRDVAIQYENDLDVAAVGIAKNSVRVFLLRSASDFRDIALPKSTAGRALISLYYEDGMKDIWIGIFLSVFLALLTYTSLRRRKSIFPLTRMNRARTHS
jgi:hypothetical protein